MTHYETLGVSKDASNEDIKRAYKAKSKQYHPDSNNGVDQSVKEDMIRKVNSAKILLDPEKRKRYDNGEPDQPSGNPVFTAVASMVLQEFSNNNFDSKSIWKAVIKNTKKVIANQKKEIINVLRIGKNIKALTKQDNIIGKMAKTEYQKLMIAVIGAHNNWNLNRKIMKFINDDCDCIDDIMREIEDVDRSEYFTTNMYQYPIRLSVEV